MSSTRLAQNPTRKASKAIAATQTEITLLVIDATVSKNQNVLAKLEAIRDCLRTAKNELNSINTGN